MRERFVPETAHQHMLGRLESAAWWKKCTMAASSHNINLSLGPGPPGQSIESLAAAPAHFNEVQVSSCGGGGLTCYTARSGREIRREDFIIFISSKSSSKRRAIISSSSSSLSCQRVRFKERGRGLVHNLSPVIVHLLGSLIFLRGQNSDPLYPMAKHNSGPQRWS